MPLLSELSTVLSGTLQGQDVEYASSAGVSIDSRTIRAGQLYWALSGSHFDGHDFVMDVERAHAAAAIVSRKIPTHLPQILVDDTQRALNDFAIFQRAQHPNVACVAITGSCGKTTTRAILGHLLRGCGTTLESEKSFNNHIGVPYTLAQLNSEHQYAVFEVGANHVGEIAPLSCFIRPKVAVITMVAPVHIEGFGDLDRIAATKAEIFQGLTADGVGVINIDDPYFFTWRQLLKNKNQQILTFGFDAAADVRASDLQMDEWGYPSFYLQTPNGSGLIQLPLLGAHNCVNALAASAAAVALGIAFAKIQHGLQSVQAVDLRLNLKKTPSGVTILDDSYNANPTAMAAALQILSRYSAPRVAILGDMGELGMQAEQQHAAVGQLAHDLKIDYLFGYGELSAATVKGFGQAGRHFSTQEALIDYLRGWLPAGASVLVKGSKSMKMWRVTRALLAEGCSAGEIK